MTHDQAEKNAEEKRSAFAREILAKGMQSQAGMWGSLASLLALVVSAASVVVATLNPATGKTMLLIVVIIALTGLFCVYQCFRCLKNFYTSSYQAAKISPLEDQKKKMSYDDDAGEWVDRLRKWELGGIWLTVIAVIGIIAACFSVA